MANQTWLLLALLTSIECCSAQDAKPSKPPRDRGFPAIVDSGSTNANGFRILVEPSGRTQSIVVPRNPGPQPIELPETTIGMIPAGLAKRLYSDLDRAWPIRSLPKQHCAKSASFGSILIIQFDGQETPDLSCGGGTNRNLRALVDDAQQIVNASAKR
jgi:hypothetical protein